jgi:hypothetical protein
MVAASAAMARSISRWITRREVRRHQRHSSNPIQLVRHILAFSRSRLSELLDVEISFLYSYRVSVFPIARLKLLSTYTEHIRYVEYLDCRSHTEGSSRWLFRMRYSYSCFIMRTRSAICICRCAALLDIYDRDHTNNRWWYAWSRHTFILGMLTSI